MIDQETRQQFEDEVYLICGEDKKTALCVSASGVRRSK